MAFPVVLITDIGGDPDDTYALLFAKNSPEIDLQLLVTSDEHHGHRYAFVSELLDRLSYHVPLVQGADLGNDKCCMVCNIAPPKQAETTYVEAMAETVRRNAEYGEKTHLVCISPQTELAAFLSKHPELHDHVDVLIMGGAINYRKPGPEHNIKYDVAAAREVFYTDVPKRYVISDTTFKPDILAVGENHPLFERICSSAESLRKLLEPSIRSFFEHLHPDSIMHDPLTLSHLIRPELVTFREEHIHMDEGGVMHLSEDGVSTLVSANASYKKLMQLLDERIRL